MSAQGVARSIDQAMLKAGLTYKNAPKLLSDNGPCYIASSLKEHLSTKFNMKRVIKLQHYLAPSELEEAIGEWVECYNEQRYHESLGNLRSIDV